MKHMSFFLTQRQFLDGSKDVTRRLGWAKAKPGEICMAVEKGQGLKKGEKAKRLGPFKVVSARREPLKAITPEDVVREGFPGMSPEGFIKMFCQHNGCTRRKKITRIEFKRL